MALYINRFYMLHQRMRRTKGWFKPGIATASDADHQYLEVSARAPVDVVTRPVPYSDPTDTAMNAPGAQPCAGSPLSRA